MKIRNGFVSNSSSSSFICKSELSLRTVESKLKLILDFYNKFYDKKLTFKEVFKKPFKLTKDQKSLKYKDMISDWILGDHNQPVYNREYLEVKDVEELTGYLIINSNDDNSIPWVLFQIVEDYFSGRRVHLG